jgi:hypothetical protein
MSDIEDLAARVAAIEERVGMEAGLRASQDRDLADMRDSLRAQTYLIQALSITQGQHTEQLRRIEERLGLVEVATDHARGRLEYIVGMLETLISREGG